MLLAIFKGRSQITCPTLTSIFSKYVSPLPQEAYAAPQAINITQSSADETLKLN